MTVTFKIPDEAGAKLQSVTARKRISKSEYIRHLLIGALNAESEKLSAFEQLQDLAGSVASGKNDVATNPKYMKGYGEWRR